MEMKMSLISFKKKFLKNEDYIFNNFLILTNIFLKYSNKVFIQDVYLFSVTFTVLFICPSSNS